MPNTKKMPLEISQEDDEILTIKDESQFYSLIEVEREKNARTRKNLAYDEL